MRGLFAPHHPGQCVKKVKEEERVLFFSRGRREYLEEIKVQLPLMHAFHLCGILPDWTYFKLTMSKCSIGYRIYYGEREERRE